MHLGQKGKTIGCYCSFYTEHEPLNLSLTRSQIFKFIRHVSTETSVCFSSLIYRAYKSSLEVRKNANYTGNNGMYIKRDKVRIKRIVLDLQDVIFDSRKVVPFEYEQPSLN